MQNRFIIKLISLLRPFARYFLIVWIFTIIIVSSSSDLPVLKIHTAKSEIRLDYLIHFMEYGLLACFTFLTFAGKDLLIGYRKAFFITIILISFAFLDEFHQKIIPGRSFNIKDIISNISGIIAGVIFCFLIFRKMTNET